MKSTEEIKKEIITQMNGMTLEQKFSFLDELIRSTTREELKKNIRFFINVFYSEKTHLTEEQKKGAQELERWLNIMIL